MTRVTDNDIHVAVETYLDQMRRTFCNQNGIVVIGSSLPVSIKRTGCRDVILDRSLARTSVERREIFKDSRFWQHGNRAVVET